MGEKKCNNQQYPTSWLHCQTDISAVLAIIQLLPQREVKIANHH